MRLDVSPTDEKTFVVYDHLFPNGKHYIGITCVKPINRRWRRGSNYKKQPKMYNAILKYGWENIQHRVIAGNLSLEQANRLERYYIEHFDSVENGYNVSTGGGGTFGIPCSEQTKQKISAANKGRPVSELCKLNSIRSIREKGPWNKGGHLTPEQYRKISEERKRRCNKAITGYDPVTLVAVTHFPSATEAAKYYGVSKNVISRCCHGGRKTSVGLVWRYDNDSF